MASDDNALAQATDDLIALYRSLERRTLDLPVISFAPLLISSLATLEFFLLFWFALFLMIPVNLVILIRNVFPGNWQYRPFFFTQVRYVLRWIWQGEPPSGPTIFIRPLFNLFMKGHFDRRLRRLRQEVVLSDGLDETARSAIQGRIDAALERWKTPRLTALLFTVILPAVIAIPTYYHQLIEFLASFGVRLPTDAAISFLSNNMSTHSTVILALFVPGYLLAIPTTAFLAKRGLFIGTKLDRICFPGGEEGSGAYAKEREILNSVGVHASETPVDLWLSGVAIALGYGLVLLVWDRYLAWEQYLQPGVAIETTETQLKSNFILQVSVFTVAFLVAALRRGRTGRL